MSRTHVVLLAGVTAALALLVFAGPALAETTNIANNVGKQVKAWGVALLFPVAVLVGLPALAKRDVGQAAQVTVVVILIGGFIYATPTVESIVKSLWKAFQGG